VDGEAVIKGSVDGSPFGFVAEPVYSANSCSRIGIEVRGFEQERTEVTEGRAEERETAEEWETGERGRRGRRCGWRKRGGVPCLGFRPTAAYGTS